MKPTIISFLILFLLSSCGQTTQKDNSSGDISQFEGEAKVMIYYFHGKQRCPTCVAIQKITEDTYVNLLSNHEDVKFREVDISLEENDAIAEKYEIAWSSLVIASENEHKNLTEYAFGLAMNNPDVLKELIVNETNELLNKN